MAPPTAGACLQHTAPHTVAQRGAPAAAAGECSSGKEEGARGHPCSPFVTTQRPLVAQSERGCHVADMAAVRPDPKEKKKKEEELLSSTPGGSA